MYLCILFPSIFALFALYKKCLTYPAIITAWILGFIIIYCAGIPAFLALALTFILTIVTDKIKDKDNPEKRDVYQILSNILTASLCTVLYHFKHSDIFIVMYVSVIASSLADTFASSFGSLSNGKSLNPLTFKKMKKGESGAISKLGIIASLGAGIIIGGIYFFISRNPLNYLIIIITAAIGAYFDSILGAYFQGKYQCKVCRKKCEEKYHCNKPTKLIKGYRFMDNDTVNLLNNILVFIFSYLLVK